jgi:hypothetical protein
VNRKTTWVAGLVAGGLALAGVASLMPVRESCAQTARSSEISYSQDLVPIFRGYCLQCHQPGGAGTNASGVDLSTYEGLMKGTKFGRMVIPREPDMSNLVVLIDGRASPEIRMPHGQKPLPACLRQEIWTWIFQGAKNN